MISCKNKEYNFYFSGKFDENDFKALVFYGWKYRKFYIVRDFFIINVVLIVSVYLYCLKIFVKDKEIDELFKMLKKIIIEFCMLFYMFNFLLNMNRI